MPTNTVYGRFPAGNNPMVTLQSAAGADDYGADTQIVADTGANPLDLTHIYWQNPAGIDTGIHIAIFIDGTGTTPVWEGWAGSMLGAAGMCGGNIMLPEPIRMPPNTRISAKAASAGLGAANAVDIGVGYKNV